MNNEFKYYESSQRGVWEYNNDKSFAENGTIALMCPECLNVIRISVAHDNTTEDILDKLDYFSTSVSYHGACKRCGKHSLQIPLDINIAQIVEVLNSKGYYTAFSCEGHIEKDTYETTLEIFSYPYIYFYLWNDFNILKEHPLPDTWSIDNRSIQNEIFQIYDNIIDNIPEDISCIDDEDKFIEWIYNNWNQQKRLEDIYNWAISLPEKEESIRYSEFDYIKVYGEDILKKNAEKLMKEIEE